MICLKFNFASWYDACATLIGLNIIIHITIELYYRYQGGVYCFKVIFAISQAC